MGSLATASLYRLRCKKFSPRSKRRVLGVRGRRARLAVAHTAMHASVTCERTLALHRFQAASASMPVASQSQACPSSSLAPSASRHAPHSPPRFSRPPFTRSSRPRLSSPLSSLTLPHSLFSHTHDHSLAMQRISTHVYARHTHTHSLTHSNTLLALHALPSRTRVRQLHRSSPPQIPARTHGRERECLHWRRYRCACVWESERERECVCVCVCSYAVHREE